MTGFDLNLPLDKYGAVSFDFVENLAGKIFIVTTRIFFSKQSCCF
jgi:hypothetical protein